MNVSRARIVIGVGSARTATMAARSDGSWQPVSFDGRPWLTGGVYRSGDGPVLTGAEAQHAAVIDPAGFVPDPVRRISTAEVRLGGGAVSGVDLVAALLRRCRDAAEQACGRPPAEAVVVVPPGWGPPRRALLRQAAQQAGLTDPVLVPAAHAVAAHGNGIDVPVAGWIAVCDLGTRTTVTVVRRSATGFVILAELDTDAGGDQIDTALARHLATQAATHAATQAAGHVSGPATGATRAETTTEGASRIGTQTGTQVDTGTTGRSWPATPAPDAPLPTGDLAGSRPGTMDRAIGPALHTPIGSGTAAPSGPVTALAADPAAEMTAVRAAKEAACGGTPVLLPGFGGRPAVMVTAAQVQHVAGQVLPAAVASVRQAVAAAEVPPETCAGLVLVGGTARIPGVGELFTDGTGLPTRVLPHPDLAAVTAAALADPGSLADHTAHAATTAGTGPGADAVKDAALSGRPSPASWPDPAVSTGRTRHGAADQPTDQPAGQDGANPSASASWPRRTARRLATVRLAVGPALPAGASLLLVTQALGSDAENFDFLSRLAKLMHAGALMMAAVCAVVAAAAFAAVYGPTLLVPSSTLRPAVHAALERRAAVTALFGAALVGTAIGAAYGLLTATAYESIYRPRWFFPLVVCLALVPTLAAAVGVAAAGIAIKRDAEEPENGWTRFLTMPYRAAALGPAGMISMEWAMAIPYDPDQTELMLRGGGAAIGIATACLLADRLWTQLIIAVPLTYGAIYLTSEPLNVFAGVLALPWAAGVVWWWARRAWELSMTTPIPAHARYGYGYGPPTHTWTGDR